MAISGPGSLRTGDDGTWEAVADLEWNWKRETEVARGKGKWDTTCINDYHLLFNEIENTICTLRRFKTLHECTNEKIKENICNSLSVKPAKPYAVVLYSLKHSQDQMYNIYTFIGMLY